MAAKKQRRPQLLSSTRPRNIKPTLSLSSRTTRSLIRSHHTLRKQFSAALAKGDTSEAQAIQAKIDASGGLPKYQEASKQGQSAQRGGDTSKILTEWLTMGEGEDKISVESGKRLRMLEVGALRPDNACSRSGLFDMERIDLHSQHPDIKQQDFIERPTCAAGDLDQEGFDIVSLSLVVNFVGDPVERGEMLRRVASFLRPYSGRKVGLFPGLFLVLPAPCVANSRYLDEERLNAIMESLGYKRAKRKLSAKLVYYLWKYEAGKAERSKVFKKEEIRSGKSRNNFAIVLR
ncbi:hypothetical protein HO173_000214 [Letharia columbiana]|uniref:25S rRNA adenine-N(1) methyltransferase n=1 Tax=Letharia columbiana TaxID=112416 RepID=A0A8H6G6S5_9LECA|nr:uncharacterized protein HO173_000214 [Letharia columbiana]KAF6241504.1 hypothetical protein HO173_000214 [Letharia columbiana]